MSSGTMILTIGHVILLLAAAAAAASHPPFNHPPPPSVPLSPLQYVFFLCETGMSRVKGSAGSPLPIHEGRLVVLAFERREVKRVVCDPPILPAHCE